MTKGKKPIYTMSDIAKQAKTDPKNVRAKFRRFPKLRPFDHTKVKEISAVRAKAAVAFMKTDFRVSE